MFTLRITVGMHILKLGSVKFGIYGEKRTFLKRAWGDSPGGILRTPFVYVLKIIIASRQGQLIKNYTKITLILHKDNLNTQK